MHKRDYYEILGLTRDASQEEIKKVFRGLARQYHPDVASNKTEAEKKFKEINEAYAVLSDSEKKELYDRYGHEGLRAGGTGFGDFDFGFSGFGDFSEIFESFFDFGRSHRTRSEGRRAARGADIRYDIEITLEEAYRGIEKDIVLNSFQKCEACKGKGYGKESHIIVCSLCQGSGEESSVQNTPFGRIIRTHMCPKCHGEGKIPDKPCKDCQGSGKTFKKKTVKVKIPAGIESDSRIRIPGQGETGDYGGSGGDLYVFVFIKPHSVFKRKGDDLFVERDIFFTEATLGAEINIPTLDGDVKLKIPAGTQSGILFKVKNKGIPHLNERGKGDLYVKVTVLVPTKLNDEQKNLLREFANAGSQEAEKSFFEKIKDAFVS